MPDRNANVGLQFGKEGLEELADLLERVEKSLTRLGAMDGKGAGASFGNAPHPSAPSAPPPAGGSTSWGAPGYNPMPQPGGVGSMVLNVQTLTIHAATVNLHGSGLAGPGGPVGGIAGPGTAVPWDKVAQQLSAAVSDAVGKAPSTGGIGTFYAARYADKGVREQVANEILQLNLKAKQTHTDDLAVSSLRRLSSMGSSDLHRFMDVHSSSGSSSSFSDWMKQQRDDWNASGQRQSFQQFVGAGPGRAEGMLRLAAGQSPWGRGNEMAGLARLAIGNSLMSTTETAISLAQASTASASESRAAAYFSAAGGGLMGAAGVMAMVPGIGWVPSAVAAGVGAVSSAIGGGINASYQVAAEEGALLRQASRGAEGWNTPNGDTLYHQARRSGIGVKEYLSMHTAMGRFADDPRHSAALDQRVRGFRGILGSEAQYMAGHMAHVSAMALQPGRDAAIGDLRAGRFVSQDTLVSLYAGAAFRGDFDALSTLDHVSRGQGLGLVKSQSRDTAQRALGHQFDIGMAGQQVGLAGLVVSMAQAGQKGFVATSAAIRGQVPALQQQRDTMSKQIAEGEQYLREHPNDGPTAQWVNQLRLQLGQVEVQLTAAPFQAMESDYSGRMALGGSASGVGRTGLSMLQQTGQLAGAGSAGAFRQIGSGTQEQIAATTQYLAAKKRAGVGEDVLAPIRAHLVQLQAQGAMLPFEQIQFGYGQSMASAGGIAGAGHAELGIANLTRLYGSGQASAYGQIHQGLNQQLSAAETQLSGLVNAGAGAALTNPARAEIARIQQSIGALIVQEFQQAFNDAKVPFQTASTVASAQLGAMRSLGQMPGSGMASAMSAQSGAARGLLGVAQQEHQLAVQRFGVGSPQELQAQAKLAQAQAAVAVLPMEQLGSAYAPMRQEVGASQSILSSRIGATLAAGGGSRDTYQQELQRVSEAERSATMERDYLARLRTVPGVGDAAIRTQEAAVARADQGVVSARTDLGSIHLPAGMRDSISQGRYAISIMGQAPGGYGNYRGALMGQMDLLSQKDRYLAERMNDPTLTDEARFRIREERRSVGMEQMGHFMELNQGWESRLTSMALGTRGDVNLQARGFSPMDAVLGGVMNPHYGQTAGQRPVFESWANLIHMPSRVPGWKGPLEGPDGGNGWGQWGMPGLQGQQGGPNISVTVVLKDGQGRELGQGRGAVHGAAGSVQQGVTSGGLEGFLIESGALVARQ